MRTREVGGPDCVIDGVVKRPATKDMEMLSRHPQKALTQNKRRSRQCAWREVIYDECAFPVQ